MRVKPVVAGLAAGAVLGLGGVSALDTASQPAIAQADKVAVTPEQLLINQRISQAAVRRSNRALNYLAPIRTAQTDAADDGRKGVIALRNIPGSGSGWTAQQIARGAITTPKLGADAVASDKIADGGVGSDDLAENSVTSSKIAAGAVGTTQIAAGAVGTTQIAEGGVTTADLAAGAVTGPKLAARSVGPGALNTPDAASLEAVATIPTGSGTNVAFAAPAGPASFDTAGFFDPTTPGTVRTPRDGIYRLDVMAFFANPPPGAGGGYRQINLTRTLPGPAISVGPLATSAAVLGADTTIGGTLLIRAGAGDEIRISVFQNSGGNLTVATSLGISYLGPPGIV